MDKLFLKLVKNNNYQREIITDWLESNGYERMEIVSQPSQYKFSGENFLVRPVNNHYLVKIVFFGDKIESIKYVDRNVKSIKNIHSIELKSNTLVLDDKIKISKGNYVVHQDHGIGIFNYFEIRKIKDEFIDYIVIEYAREAKLYSPLNQIHKLSSYIGVGRKKPALSRLGSVAWKKTYQKTYENIILFARELLGIYAKREIVIRPAYEIHNDWNGEIKSNFGYIETPDQDKAISEVLQDLKTNHPIDRLICGDVGFGKTEVAVRAIAQVCANGYQSALLVPTTILAEQHFATLTLRFKNLPIKIVRLSRLVNSKSQTETINEIENGQADLIIATHKILNKSVKFKNLGLLVIDEEQRFGVKQKELLKKMKSSIDVLSLSATPIPRTLFMALSGIRDISSINMPPKGRREIKTEVAIFDIEKVNQYIEREINRNGQIYYLHNDVATIEGTRKKLQKLFPNLKIAVAHGQMHESQLAITMSQFASGKIQILVCSTIIENGLDLPNVNTLIVEECDRFGLSQLYQIRGRIGRSPRQGYALFTFRKKEITKNAYKRLNSLLDNTELGAGYNIALSDLEIRGGGNILGREQHGNMEAVGLVLYTKMLKLAIKKLDKK